MFDLSVTEDFEYQYVNISSSLDDETNSVFISLRFINAHSVNCSCSATVASSNQYLLISTGFESLILLLLQPQVAALMMEYVQAEVLFHLTPLGNSLLGS